MTALMQRLTLFVLLFITIPLVLAPAVRHANAASGTEVVVRLTPDAYGFSDTTLEDVLQGRIVTRLPELSSLHLRLTTDEALGEAVARLQRVPWVVMAEGNPVVHTTLAPNDPFYSTQAPYLALIEAPDAWDIETGHDSVLVAILDSGISLEHPDLQGRIWTNINETQRNGIDDDSNGCIDDLRGCNFVTKDSADPHCTVPSGPGDVKDDNGHGTFIAGIIAANGNNGIGLVGVAPGVTILPVKILDCYGGGTAVDAAQGVLYAARNGARVANISFNADGESATLASAIREAHDRYGMVIVAASGNEGKAGVRFPARLPETIAVGSAGVPGDYTKRSTFSNWGPEVAVVAPGLNVVSTVSRELCGTWVCVQEQPYAVASGTSFAAPMVTALAALIVSKNPFIAPEDVRAMIMRTAVALPAGETPGWSGAGRIRMQQALKTRRYITSAPGISH
jgi:subtilisin family serine protease